MSEEGANNTFKPSEAAAHCQAKGSFLTSLESGHRVHTGIRDYLSSRHWRIQNDFQIEKTVAAFVNIKPQMSRSCLGVESAPSDYGNVLFANDESKRDRLRCLTSSLV